MGMRLSEFTRLMSQLGFQLEPPSSGSHWKMYDPSGKMYTIPSHGGMSTELDDKYLRSCCRTFGIDIADILDKKKFKKLKESRSHLLPPVH